MEVIDVAGKLLGLAVADVGASKATRAPADSASEDEDTRWSRADSAASSCEQQRHSGVRGSTDRAEAEEENSSDDDNSSNGKRKRMSAEDRKARNRERNRLHARKTRQRKKQHVQELQLKIWGLRQERQRLLQHVQEHRTAGVLLALSCSPSRCVQGTPSQQHGASTGAAPVARDWSRELASHEETLRKITQEFESMDGGQHAGEDGSVTGGAALDEKNGGPKGGGVASASAQKGTLADRTALRRERNRMHAKRTRNRKKLFVEACSVMINKMVRGAPVARYSFHEVLFRSWGGVYVFGGSRHARTRSKV